MTKKDFEAIARILKSKDGRIDAVEMIAEDLADLFAADNPRFDRDRFIEACGIQ